MGSKNSGCSVSRGKSTQMFLGELRLGGWAWEAGLGLGGGACGVEPGELSLGSWGGAWGVKPGELSLGVASGGLGGWASGLDLRSACSGSDQCLRLH